MKCSFCNKELKVVEEALVCACKKFFCMKHMDKIAHKCNSKIKKWETDVIQASKVERI